MRLLIDTRDRHWEQNPFVRLYCESLSPYAKVLGFSWTRALLGRYSLVHVHWPEYLTDQPTRLRRVASRILMATWLLRLSALRTPVIRTHHDREPFIPIGRIDQLLQTRLDKLVRGRVFLTDPVIAKAQLTAGACPTAIIPHGEYNPWLETLPAPSAGDTATVPTVFCFGILRPYKRFEDVIKAAVGTDMLTLEVAGSAPDATYVAMLEQLARQGKNINVKPGRVTDDELITTITNADLIVVPYEDLYNSGVVFLAMALNTPVLVRANPVAAELRDEYGSEWIIEYEPDLDAASLQQAADLARHQKGKRAPSPERRNWTKIAQAHFNLFEDAMMPASRARRNS